MRKISKRGFTLVEVLVALGIAGGSLILLLSACRASLRRTQRATENSQLELQAQSKLDELRAGVEPATRGVFPALTGYEWNVTTEPAQVSAVKELKRMTLHVKRSGEAGGQERQFSVLQYIRKVERR